MFTTTRLFANLLSLISQNVTRLLAEWWRNFLSSLTWSTPREKITNISLVDTNNIFTQTLNSLCLNRVNIILIINALLRSRVSSWFHSLASFFSLDFFSPSSARNSNLDLCCWLRTHRDVRVFFSSHLLSHFSWISKSY